MLKLSVILDIIKTEVQSMHEGQYSCWSLDDFVVMCCPNKNVTPRSLCCCRLLIRG